MDVYFYHLDRRSLEDTLPDLLERTLARGWRAQVRPGSPERAAALDAWLWTYRDDSFLPHGLAHEAFGAVQPILLGFPDGNLNAAQALFLVDGARPGDWTALRAQGFARVALIFSGRDVQAVEAAREDWKSAKAAALDVQYWQETAAGKWEKRA